MSEILEIKQNIPDVLKKEEDIPHYPKFEEIIDELTHSQLVAMAKGYYEVLDEQIKLNQLRYEHDIVDELEPKLYENFVQ